MAHQLPVTPPASFVGIDAGGSSIVVRAVADGEVVFARRDGPGNATSSPVEAVLRHLTRALDGCPAPVWLGGCFAGLRNPKSRALVAELLARRFPDTEVRLAPDFVAVLLCAPDEFDVYCIAGTGSVCCSQAAGAVHISGGRGYLLGDHGSAFRYGQALAAFALETDDEDLHPLVSRALADVFGTVDRRSIVQIVHASPAPAPLLGRLAPTLTRCAEMGNAWAEQLVAEEATAFARVAAHHVRRFHPGRDTVRLGLAGGVWTSGAVVARFTAAVSRCLEPRVVAVHPLPAPPVVGAVELARLPWEEVRHLVY